MNLHVHTEAVALLELFGVCCAILMIFVMRLTSWPWSWVFAKLADKSAEAMDSREDHLPRRLRKRFKWKEEDYRNAKISFYALCSVTAAWVVADWFLLPERYSVGSEWRWALAASAFFAGGIAISVGRCYFDQRIGWKKWSFWFALIATALCLLVFLHWVNPRRPRAVLDWMFTGCAISLFVFFYFFGMLRRVERRMLPANVVADLIAARSVAKPNSTKRKHRRRKR